MKLLKPLAVAALAVVFSTPAIAAGGIDPKLPDYSPVQGVSGNLKSIGSDTMNNEMTLWAEGYQTMYPNVQIEIEGKGSSTAPPALIAGTSQFGPMSRPMKAKEVDDFEKAYGYKPTVFRTSIDMLAIYVNKDNPIKGLSFEQIDAIFSKTRKRGYPNEITTWGQLGLTGEWKDRPITLYGRNSASGTYGYFKDDVLKKGDYKDQVKEQPGSASVVQGVTEDKAGIGYSGIGYKTSGVKALPLSKTNGEQAFEPNYENVLSGKYPLSRMLYINVVKEPNTPLSPLVKEFIKFVLSKEGQEIVVKDGYLPLPNAVVEKQLQLLD